MRTSSRYTRRTGVTMAEMQARVRASLATTTLNSSQTPVRPVTPEEAAIAAEEKRYADQRVMFRN